MWTLLKYWGRNSRAYSRSDADVSRKNRKQIRTEQNKAKKYRPKASGRPRGWHRRGNRPLWEIWLRLQGEKEREEMGR